MTKEQFVEKVMMDQAERKRKKKRNYLCSSAGICNINNMKRVKNRI